MTRELKDSRSYWQYEAVMDGRTRPAHAAMNGKVLPADSPFWKRNFPPNGFNCRCTVVSVSKSEIVRDGLEVEEDLPDMADMGFLNNPGEINYRDILAQVAFKKAEKENWIPLTDYGPEKYDSPEKVPYEPMPSRLGPTLEELRGNKQKLRQLFHEAIGGESVLVNTPDGSSIIL